MSSTPGPSRSPLQRAVYLCLGLVMVGLGIIGAILPLMPTTIFLILAAWFFSRSSPRLEAYLMNSRFGGPLRDWRENGAISRKSKMLALTGMSVGYAVFLIASKPSVFLAIAVGASILASAAYVVSRPSSTEPNRPKESDV
ncbi:MULTISPECIES: YbaN family protein [unclassified Rhizobium]|uniref:YbaN family protein n=1 Tax=unclassified Rhizobium TaxID=2613769 RepID=UPI000DD9F401|nr:MULTISPECIES: YbaN family protein [unclassified Rhizobium]